MAPTSTRNRPASSVSGQTAEDVRKPDDRRVSRTRRSIDVAFLQLLKQRGYDAVAVSDIVREADVGRATFYEHYTSKDDLLRSQMRHVSTLLRVTGASAPVLDATPLLAHVRDVPLLYRLVAGRTAAARTLRILQDVLEERAAALLTDQLEAGIRLRDPLEPAVAARVIVGSLCALLSWWVERGMPETPAQVQQLFQACTGAMVEPAHAPIGP